MGIAATVGDALSLEGIPYQIVQHNPSACSTQSAREAGIRLSQLAKAVLLKDYFGHLLAVLPASRRLDLERLNRQLHRRLILAEEDELDHSFYDCRLGAVPPLGPWYRIPTVIDVTLRGVRDVYFEAGDHETLIRVDEAAFAQLLEGVEYMDFSDAFVADGASPEHH